MNYHSESYKEFLLDYFTGRTIQDYMDICMMFVPQNIHPFIETRLDLDGIVNDSDTTGGENLPNPATDLLPIGMIVESLNPIVFKDIYCNMYDNGYPRTVQTGGTASTGWIGDVWRNSQAVISMDTFDNG